MTHTLPTPNQTSASETGVDLLEIWEVLLQRWRSIVATPIIVALLVFGALSLVAPTFTAKTTLLAPQQQQSAALSALSSLSALSGLGNSSNARNTGDQLVALLQSAKVQNRIIEHFNLMQVYKAKYHVEARERLAHSVRVELGKKDGMISLEADAGTPAMAADIANQYVVELSHLSGELALTEAQQRRVFFEAQLKQTHDRLAQSQIALQNSGFSAGALKTEPRSAAEGYAALQAQVRSAEVRLQTMRRSLADSSPDVQSQMTQLAALRAEIAKLESSASTGADADYISRYRDFKYQETLYDLFAKQYEAARLDESRDGALIQVVDVATPPELKSKPKRGPAAVIAALVALVIVVLNATFRHFWSTSRLSAAEPRRDLSGV